MSPLRRGPLLIALVAVIAFGASASPAAAAPGCSDIEYTNMTPKDSNETIRVDVFGTTTIYPSGVQIGSFHWSLQSGSKQSYSDHTGSTWFFNNQARGTYDVWIKLPNLSLPCRNPDGQFTIT
jgi:hypothetical protein